MEESSSLKPTTRFLCLAVVVGLMVIAIVSLSLAFTKKEEQHTHQQFSNTVEVG